MTHGAALGPGRNFLLAARFREATDEAVEAAQRLRQVYPPGVSREASGLAIGTPRGQDSRPSEPQEPWSGPLSHFAAPCEEPAALAALPSGQQAQRALHAGARWRAARLRGPTEEEGEPSFDGGRAEESSPRARYLGLK